jgi:two-component system response regulator HydG
MTNGGIKPRILIVDNEDSVRLTFESVLTRAGYTVDTAGTSEEALTKIDETAFDLIYLDTELGAKNGIDVLREIRNKHLPVSVLMVTGDPNATSAKEAFELGAFGHISKPISHDKLLRLTRLALQS